MNRQTMIGILIGAGIATTGAVVAGYNIMQDEGDRRPSLSTSAPTSTASTPTTPGTTAYAPTRTVDSRPTAEECERLAAEQRDPNRIAGTAIGAVVGGAVGRDVGDRDITTAAGAAAGALAGREIQERVQENRAEKAAAAAGC